MTELSTCANLKFSIADGVGRIVLDRQERMNAFTFEMIDAWAAALRHCRADDAVKVITVTGAGSAFCSGGDIVEMTERLGQTPEQRKSETFERVQRIPLALEDLDKPVIAIVNGVATGAGMDLALMCDIRYAAQSARFAETYVKVGLVPGAGGAHFLPRLVGASKALELFLTAEFIDADEALRLGLVNKVFPDASLAEDTAKVIPKMTAGPTFAVRAMKRAIYQGMRNDLRTSLDLISSHYAVATACADHREAVGRFVAKRKIS
ncbi:MAG TPA: enoyl-CoA hydratase-related protein [Alphaproteobacteria bacterium]|nr:enoyl-CoA hydratase-related protein [Alphaproteobacteria bacterium]